MQLGISSFTFGWAVGVRGFAPPVKPLDALGLLQKARELDVSLVQIGDNLPLHALDAAALDELSQRAKRWEIALEIGARGLRPDNLSRHLDLAKRLKARLLRFVIDEGDYEPAPQDVVSILREALPGFGDVSIGIENHDRFSAQALRSIIEAVGDVRVGICLDTANSLGAGEGLHHVASVLAPVTLNWHIKDYAIERLPHAMGFSVTGRPAGAGQMDLDFVRERLESAARCRSAVLELWTPPENDAEQTIAKEAQWAAQSLEFLKKWDRWEVGGSN